MKDKTFSWLGGIVSAWEMLLDIPIPGIIRKYADRKNTSVISVAAGFVILGAAAGLLLAAAGGILNVSWINRFAAALLFSLAATAFCEYKDSGRGFRLLVSAIRRKLAGNSFSEAILEAAPDDGSFEHSSGNLGSICILLFELIAFALLAYYRVCLWSVAVFAGAFTIQMLFATLYNGNGAFLPIPQNRIKQIWIAPLAVTMVLFLIFPAATIAAAAIVGCLGQIIHRDLAASQTPISADVITLSGKITELFLLLCGLIFVL